MKRATDRKVDENSGFGLAAGIGLNNDDPK